MKRMTKAERAAHHAGAREIVLAFCPLIQACDRLTLVRIPEAQLNHPLVAPTMEVAVRLIELELTSESFRAATRVARSRKGGRHGR